jgi:RNA-directed DNA polymerase
MGAGGWPHGSRASLGMGKWGYGLRLDARSRMSRKVHGRICEGVGVRLPRATRRIVGFAHRDDAERFWSALRDRRGQCNRERHPEKMRLIECGRVAVERRQRRAQGKPAPFDFFGFTHLSSHTRHGKCTVRRKTMAQRLRKKLRAVKDTLRRRMHWPIPQQGAWRQSVLLGH